MKRRRKSPLNPPPEDVGKPSITIQWQTFVKVVLEVTIEAYQTMRQKRSVRREWEEDTFTLNLFKHLLPLASRHPIGLNVKPQVLVFTPEMETGEVSTNEAKKIDIQLWLGSWENHDRIYFAWEAKLIADRYLQESYEHLIAEYVTNGIVNRFIDGKYSSEVNDAGMLGYILAGDANSIVDQINRSMLSSQRIRKLSEEDYLTKYNTIDGFTDIYNSYHKRVFCDRAICLYHLFLIFDYI